MSNTKETNNVKNEERTTDHLSIGFPLKGKCAFCDEEHTADFLGAFVRDTAGNWYLDLGKRKGAVLVKDGRLGLALEDALQASTMQKQGTN